MTTVAHIRYLAKFLDNKPLFKENGKSNKKIAILDVETTDLKKTPVEITELALKIYYYDKNLLSEDQSYQSYNEPKNLENITEEITKLTGISKEIVSGHKIDWNKVNHLLSDVDFIIAHNAKFDKSHVEHFIMKKIWLCSLNGIDWLNRIVDGFVVPSKKLEMLCLHFGQFTYDGHRAINDVEALACLIQSTETLEELLSSKDKVKLVVKGFIDAYQKTDVKNIVTTPNNEIGAVLTLRIEDVNGKKNYWYETPPMDKKILIDVENKLRNLVRRFDSNVEKKLQTSFEQVI